MAVSLLDVRCLSVGKCGVSCVHDGAIGGSSVAGAVVRAADSSCVELNGTVKGLKFRSGRYAIAVVTADGAELSCKGEIDTVVIGMPFSGEVEPSSPAPARGGGGVGSKDFTIVHAESPPRAWRRLAGVVSYLRNGGVAALEGAGYQLVTTFGAELPAVLLESPERLSAIRALGDDLGPVYAELDRARVALRCAGDLGEAGYEWLVGTCMYRYGPAGPVIAAEDIGSVVADGVVSAADVVGLATTLSERMRLLGAGLSLERARSGWRGATVRFASDYARSLFGSDGEGLVGDAVAAEVLVRRRQAIVSAGDDGALRVVESEVERLVESGRPVRGGGPEIAAHRERKVVSNILDSPVSLVETPAGASGAWLDGVLGHAAGAGWRVRVLYPDRRGHLLGGWERGRVVDDPDLVVLVDAHRLDYDEVARRLLGVASGTRLVVAGDRISWAPGHGGNLVRELIATAAFPVVGLDGSGATWGLRCGETIERCVEVRYGRAPAGTPVVWSEGPTLSTRREGARVMIGRMAREVGAGALGTIVTADPRARVTRVELDGLDAVDFPPGWLVAGNRIPVSHLPGVRSSALYLARKLAPAQLYAAVSAAKVLYVKDKDFLDVGEMTEQKSVLLDIGAVARRQVMTTGPAVDVGWAGGAAGGGSDELARPR